MLRFRSKSSVIGWTGVGGDRAWVGMKTSNEGILKLSKSSRDTRETLRPFGCVLARAQQWGYDCDEPDRRPNEDRDIRVGTVARRVAARGAGSPAPGWGESAVYDGVLLQGAVGAS